MSGHTHSTMKARQTVTDLSVLAGVSGYALRVIVRVVAAVAMVTALAMPATASESDASMSTDGSVPGVPLPGDETAVIDYTSRVIGGSRSSAGQWPWTVALIFNGGGPLSFRQFCGGSAIAPRWVLTAAHCMYDLSERPLTLDNYTIAAGFTNLATEHPQEISPVNAYIHPLYNNNDQSAQHDLALIELASDLPAELLTPFTGDTEALAGETAYTMGWGAIDYTNPDYPTYPDEMRHVSVPLVSRAACNAPGSYAGSITEFQVCAGYVEGGVDACVGDSGGPLVLPIGGVWRQVGLVSFGRGCAEPNYYGIYTNVSAHSLWINDYVPGYRDAGSDGSGTGFSTGGSGTGGTSDGTTSGGAAGDSGGALDGALASLLVFAGILRLAIPQRRRIAMRCVDTRDSRRVHRHASPRPGTLLSCSLALMLTSCMSTQTLARFDASAPRLGFDMAHLGDARDAVVEALGSGTEPACQLSKVGAAGSPRPVRLEICTFDDTGLLLGGEHVEHVTAHFVDGYLARLAVSAGGATVLDNWQSMLTEPLGEADLRPSVEAGLRELVWARGDDEARLVPGGADDTAGIELVLVDARLERRASWLR